MAVQGNRSEKQSKAVAVYTVHFMLTLVVGCSVWLGLAIGETALALHRNDAFGLALGLGNVLISASTVFLDVLVLRGMLG